MEQELTRRRFLRGLGIGTGAVVVAGAGAFTYRAADQGVFSTGDGAAYEAWRDWQAGSGPVSFVGAAVLAANAHDSQPWLFHVSGHGIELFADTQRNLGAMDPLRREMYVSLGCALENLVLAAQAKGFMAQVTLLPDHTDRTHVARVELAPAPAPAEASPLYRAIPDRHTDRAAYETGRHVDASMLAQIAALGRDPDVTLLWLTGPEDMRAFGRLTISATQAIIDDPEQSAASFAWMRQDWDQIQQKKDGLTVDTSGLSSFVRVLAKILPAQSQESIDASWLDATRNRVVATAAAYGLVVAQDRADGLQRLKAGRLYQRAHLFATTKGLSMQPLAQTVERADREKSAGLPPKFTGPLDAFARGWQVVLPFRIGYPTTTPPLSPRRPADEVLV